jgi:hypothetical protein
MSVAVVRFADSRGWVPSKKSYPRTSGVDGAGHTYVSSCRKSGGAWQQPVMCMWWLVHPCRNPVNLRVWPRGSMGAVTTLDNTGIQKAN